VWISSNGQSLLSSSCSFLRAFVYWLLFLELCFEPVLNLFSSEENSVKTTC